MKKDDSRRIGALVLALATLIVVALVGLAAPPHGEGGWVQSGVEDCGPEHICVKWEIQGMPPDDQCCIPPANLYDDDPFACNSNLRHGLH